MNPYTHIHSYLNIPDTSGRDSLFQAESRRCKEIIDVVNESDENTIRHFCIFDELFSGTNPTEATQAAHAFLTYLSKRKNIDFMLTTHYIALCKKFKVSKDIQNYMMATESDDSHKTIRYTYKIKKGISKVKGGILILEEMRYPVEILDTIRNN
jgi:DNA mismatch repair ATPase MutS